MSKIESEMEQLVSEQTIPTPVEYTPEVREVFDRYNSGKISLGDAENEMTSLGYALDIPDDTTDTSADIVISVPSRLSEDNVRPTGEVTSRGTAASVDAVTKTAPQEDLNIEVQKDAPVPEQPKQVAEKPTPPSADPPDIQIDEPTQRTLPLPSIFAPAGATAGQKPPEFEGVNLIPSFYREAMQAISGDDGVPDPLRVPDPFYAENHPILYDMFFRQSDPQKDAAVKNAIMTATGFIRNEEIVGENVPLHLKNMMSKESFKAVKSFLLMG